MNELILVCLMVIVITFMVCLTFGFIVVMIGLAVTFMKEFWRNVVQG